MRCPACGGRLGVVDSRDVKSENAVRRRRQCLACASRVTTRETIEDADEDQIFEAQVLMGLTSVASRARERSRHG